MGLVVRSEYYQKACLIDIFIRRFKAPFLQVARLPRSPACCVGDYKPEHLPLSSVYSKQHCHLPREGMWHTLRAQKQGRIKPCKKAPSTQGSISPPMVTTCLDGSLQWAPIAELATYWCQDCYCWGHSISTQATFAQGEMPRLHVNNLWFDC